MRYVPHVRHDWKTSSSNCLRGIQIGNLNHLHWFLSHEAVTATFEKTKTNYTSVMNYESWLKTRVCVWSKLFSWLSITSDSLFYHITSSQNLKYCRRLKKSVSAKYAVGSLRGTKTALTLEGLDSTWPLEVLFGIEYQDISRGCSESPGSCEWSLGGSELFQLVYKHPVTNSCHQRLSSDHWW